MSWEMGLENQERKMDRKRFYKIFERQQVLDLFECTAIGGFQPLQLCCVWRLLFEMFSAAAG